MAGGYINTVQMSETNSQLIENKLLLQVNDSWKLTWKKSEGQQVILL